MFGIEPVSEASSSQHTITEMAALLESERAENRDLQRKIQVLEARIQELERTSASGLAQQADASHTSLTACGPDSYEHFHGFSIDGVIWELKEQVPDIYTFWQMFNGMLAQTKSLEHLNSRLSLHSAPCSMPDLAG